MDHLDIENPVKPIDEVVLAENLHMAHQRSKLIKMQRQELVLEDSIFKFHKESHTFFQFERNVNDKPMHVF